MWNIKGKICLITGATSGLGYHTAFELAKQGAIIGMIARDRGKCRSLADRIRAKTGNPFIDCFIADLSEPFEIRALVNQILNRYDKLNVLVNNAGARFLTLRRNSHGVEMTYALNHLAYFQIANELLNMMQNRNQSDNARIINVASAATADSPGFYDLRDDGDFDGRQACRESKLANLLFTYELARRTTDQMITVNAVDPGYVATNFNRNNGFQYWLRHLIAHSIHRNLILPRTGARIHIYLASSADVEGETGKLFRNTQPITITELDFSPEASAGLWEKSEQLLKNIFNTADKGNKNKLPSDQD